MNIHGLIENLETYEFVKDLKNAGLTQEEIDGFIEFEWDDLVDKEKIIVMEHKNDFN